MQIYLPLYFSVYFNFIFNYLIFSLFFSILPKTADFILILELGAQWTPNLFS